ncbi:MAG TPA: rhodanese-like domain-containing protein [Blastocatellia bacterium]|nr:rhodanese-like domain-containing protein [Blastocatellia bacterium]
MKLRKLLSFLLLAPLVTLETQSTPQAIAAVEQKKAKAPAKKQRAKAKPVPSESVPPASEEADVERITVDELKAKIARNELLTIIDDRSEGSYEASETQIKGSIRMTVDEIQSRIKEVPRNREIITYCT